MNELEMTAVLRSFIAENWADYVSSTSDTVLTLDDIILQQPDDDLLPNGKYGIFINANDSQYDDFDMTEDEVDLSVTLSILALQEDEVTLRDRVFEIKDTLYRMLRDNQSLGGEANFVKITSCRYFPQLFVEFNIVGMDVNLTISYCV